MQRRDLLKAAAIAPVGVAGLAAPALSQGRQEIRMTTTWPRDFPGLGTGAQRIADRITAATGGRITVNLHAAGELMGAFDAFPAVSSGEVEMYHAAEYYWLKADPGFAFYTTVPLGLTAPELNAWVLHGGGQKLWDDLAADHGIKSLMAGNPGVQMGGWFRNPITSHDDLQGLRMRMPGLGGQVLKQIGADPVSLPGGKIRPALEAGEIDATEWVGPYSDLGFGLQDLLKHYMYPGFHEPGAATSVGMNKAWWDNQTAADQALIQACCLAENEMMLGEFNKHNGASLETMLSEHGVSLHRFPEDVWKTISDASLQVVADSAQAGKRAAAIHASFNSFRKEVAAWSNIAESAFLATRARVLGILS
ncbi:MAG: TRAP transporter substrate-binding protein [Pseudomonadota bacterium]